MHQASASPNQRHGRRLADFNNDGWTDIAIATIHGRFFSS